VLGALMLAAVAGCGAAVRPPLPTTAAAAGGRAPWLAYITDVNPGGGMQFLSSRLGFTLAGQPTNLLDDHLAAGLRGANNAWPSPVVLATRAGGRRWTSSLAAPSGFWGLDFADPDHGWAVGVTGLYRTVDGGARWVRAAEPRRALVRVAFSGAATGFGLTLDGRLVATVDAGSSWHGTRWTGRGAALCVENPQAILVADQQGGLWRTGDGGMSWHQVAPDLRHVEQYAGWWPDLSCGANSGVELAQAFCMAACGGGVVSVVRQTADAGVKWRQLVWQGITAGGIHDRPSHGPTFSLQRAVTAGKGTVCLIGYPGVGVGVRVACTSDGGRSYRGGGVPRLPFPREQASVLVQGVSFVNSEDGWLLVDENTAASTPSRAKAQTQVWHTRDGGASWHTVYAGPTHPL
jgi:hypothetical protein